MNEQSSDREAETSDSALDIAVIIPELRKHGGAERFLIECLRRWQHRHHFTVYATAFNPALFVESGLTEVDTRLLTPRFEGPNATLLNATLLPKIWEAEVGRHDLYHTHLWPTHLLDLHPMVWFPHEPLRLLYDLRFSQVDDEAVDQMQKRLHFYPKETYDSLEGAEYQAVLRTIEAFDKTGQPDRVVGNSQYTAHYLEKVYGYEVPEWVYPGVTVEEMIELPGSRDIVLTIGQLWPHKRMRVIIESIAQVEGVQLYIVGSGPEKERLQKIAERMGVADRVFFLHGLDNREVQILLARCLCVVFTPAREPFGIVALEALAAGKPLIAVNEGGYSEVVDEECAMLVPMQPAMIADRIRTLQENPALAERMGRHGREVATRYSWDRTARELLEILEDTHANWVEKHVRAEKGTGPLFAVHYFSWYREGFGSRHWSDNPDTGGVTDQPLAGYYSSMNGDTLATHLEQLESIDMDVVVFNLHVDDAGMDMFQLGAAQRMQELAEKRGSKLRFAINLCLYTREPDALTSAMKVLKDSLLKRENYLEIDGRPIFMIFWSGAFDGDLAQIDCLRTFTSQYTRIGVYMRPYSGKSEHRKTQGLFDGVSQLSPLELSAPAAWEDTWQKEYDTLGQSMKYHCLTVCPGYDDTHLTDPARASQLHSYPREDGALYQRMIDFVLAQTSAPDFVFVSTFNEFHENTHIEPSVQFGKKYLDMTGDFIARARAQWDQSGAMSKTGSSVNTAEDDTPCA